MTARDVATAGAVRFSRVIVLLPFFSFIPGSASAADFALRFDACPAVAQTGNHGTIRTYEIYAALETRNAISPEGAAAWQISMGITGGTLRSISVGGIVVQTVLDHDNNDATAPQARTMDLAQAADFSELATYRDDTARQGAISAVALGGLISLKPSGLQRIAKLVVDVVVPPGNQAQEVTLKFEDGYHGRGVPLDNSITLGSRSVTPSLGESCSFQVRSGSSAGFRRGDANADGCVNGQDVAFIRAALFEDGPEPSCEDAADVNDDGRFDIQDLISLVAYGARISGALPPPPPGPSTCGSDPTADGLGCARYTACSTVCDDPWTLFKRGDVNDDGDRDISDAIFLLGSLFLGTEDLPCESAADANDDGDLDISDSSFLLNFVFLHGTTPADPLRACGIDVVFDELTCRQFDSCRP